MPSLSAYTPLEVFLFFQSLASLDAKPASFSPVSDLLKNNAFVREDVTFDPERLDPDALEELYTTLIREGIDHDGGVGSKSPPNHLPGQNGHRSESPGSGIIKKRKLPSPSRRGPDDAPTHSTVVPSLASHLYAKYKERVTREIQNEEKRYREIREEINRLENEDYDAAQSTRPENLEKPSQPAPVVPPTDTAAIATTSGVDTTGNEPRQQETVPVEAPAGAPDGQRIDDQTQETSRPAPQKAQEPPVTSTTTAEKQYSPGQIPAPQQEKASPHAVHPPQPVPPMATGHSIQPPQSSPINGNIPFLPPPQQSGRGYRLNSPSASSPSHTLSPHSQQQAQPAQPPVGSMGVLGQGPSTNPPSRSPVILPPPGVNVPPSPSRGSYGEAGSSHHRTPSGTKQFPSPQQQIHPPLQHSFQQPWSPRESPHAPYPHISPYANTSPYPNNHPAAARPLPVNSTPYGHPEHTRPLQNPYAQPSQMVPGGTPGFGQSPHPTVEGTPFSPADRAHLHKSTPSQTPSFSSRRPHRLPSLDTTGSSTPWKKSSLRVNTSKSPGSPVQPRPEDVSPISERAPSPSLESPRPEPADQKQEQKTGEPVTRAGKRKAVPPLELRDVSSFDSNRRSPIRTRRGGSVTSPVATSSTRNRSRGHSVASREGSVTDPGSATQRKIKREIPSTPADMEISEDAEVESRASTRRRTAASQQEDAPPGRVKRKRGLSEPEEPQSQQQPPSSARPSSQYVICTRNFPRTSAPIMNDVTAHKHASIFAKPLTERDAPGYKDLIYRPQDLKSIKSAIHQGSRAVAAATEAASTPAGEGESPGTGGTGTGGAGTPSTSKNAMLTLRKTAELVPPRGIINSAQLEKELMRMFANAVMFNPTPERSFGPSFPMRSDAASRESTQVSEPEEGGIINDTREMCDDVELAVTRWRAAERTADDV